MALLLVLTVVSACLQRKHVLQTPDLCAAAQAQLQKEAEEDEEVYEKLACWCAGKPRETVARQACNFIVVSVVQRAQKRCRSVISIP